MKHVYVNGMNYSSGKYLQITTSYYTEMTSDLFDYISST